MNNNTNNNHNNNNINVYNYNNKNCNSNNNNNNNKQTSALVNFCRSLLLHSQIIAEANYAELKLHNFNSEKKCFFRSKLLKKQENICKSKFHRSMLM